MNEKKKEHECTSLQETALMRNKQNLECRLQGPSVLWFTMPPAATSQPLSPFRSKPSADQVLE